MEKTKGLALGSLVAGLLLAVSAFAQPSMDGMSMSAHGHGGMSHHMDAMGGGDSHFMMLLKSANLTPAQHAQVRQILKGEKEQMKSVYAGFHAVHEQLAARLLTPGVVTAADLAPLEQKAVRYQQQIDRNMIETALAIRNVLTPEQVTRLAQVHQQLQSLHQQIQNLMGSDADESSDQPN
jgi:Spy/CpxP family protein refolding chaperone